MPEYISPDNIQIFEIQLFIQDCTKIQIAICRKTNIPVPVRFFYKAANFFQKKLVIVKKNIRFM